VSGVPAALQPLSKRILVTWRCQHSQRLWDLASVRRSSRGFLKSDALRRAGARSSCVRATDRTLPVSWCTETWIKTWRSAPTNFFAALSFLSRASWTRGWTSFRLFSNTFLTSALSPSTSTGDHRIHVADEEEDTPVLLLFCVLLAKAQACASHCLCKGKA